MTETFAVKLEALAQFTAQPVLVDWYTQTGRRRDWQARTYSGSSRVENAEGYVRYKPQICDWLD